MRCEVEFLAVGDGSRPGDAIIVRYGDPAAYQLMVVDGGTANCGETLVAHLKKHFGALVSLEHVVLTLSFPKIQSGGIRVVRQNQRIIRCDVCDHPLACNVYSRSVQVASPA
jgi:hypothetical protein